MVLADYIVAALAGYLLGSVPAGFLAGRLKGIDIRTVGSGNIGATNVFRALGTTAGVLVLLADGAKGYLACWLLPQLVAGALPDPTGAPLVLEERLSVVAGVAAILGHNYTCWLRFRGGKGVATTAGVLLALFPKAFLIGLAVWLVVFGASRYVSVASITAAVVLPVAVWLVGASQTMIVVAGLLGALAVFKHKGNIQRLLKGTENRFGRKKSQEDLA